MAALLALVIWSAVGLATAAWMAKPGDSRWAWSPMAAILGPFWPAIATEQRSRTLASPREARFGLDRGLPGLPSPALALVRPDIDVLRHPDRA